MFAGGCVDAAAADRVGSVACSDDGGIFDGGFSYS